MHDALAQRYCEADVFVQASLHEAQGMSVLEAAACGMAIAGTPVGVLPELAERGGAIAASGFDANAIAEAIRCAMVRRKELGCRAREIVEKEFSVDVTCTHWRDLYDSALARR